MQENETKREENKGTEEKKLYECLYRGDPRVCVLMGKQKPPEEGKKIRRSRFVYCQYEKGKYGAEGYRLLRRRKIVIR